VADVGAPQELRHRFDEHRVFAEVAARGVEQRGVVGEALGDDAVAGLGHHHIDGLHQVFIAIALAVHRGLVNHARPQHVIPGNLGTDVAT